jgi:hypothetical protein
LLILVWVVSEKGKYFSRSILSVDPIALFPCAMSPSEKRRKPNVISLTVCLKKEFMRELQK